MSGDSEDEKGATHQIESAVRQDAMARWNSQKELIVEENRGALEMAATALKAAMAVNGASAVAILAFIAHQWNSEGPQRAIVAEMAGVLTYLVWGVFSVALASGLGYLRLLLSHLYQLHYVNTGRSSNWRIWLAHIFQYSAIVLVLASYALFGVAMWKARGAFLGSGS